MLRLRLRLALELGLDLAMMCHGVLYTHMWSGVRQHVTMPELCKSGTTYLHASKAWSMR